MRGRLDRMVARASGSGPAVSAGSLRREAGVGPMGASLLRRMAAEFIGTAMLVFFAAGSVMAPAMLDGLPGPIIGGTVSGLALMIVIWAFGPISGAHVNPALTVALAVANRFPWREVPGYAAAQMLGSAAAGLLLPTLLGPHGSMGANLPNLALGITPAAAIAIEIVLSAILMGVVLAVMGAHGLLAELAAVPIGATVGIEVMLFGALAGAAMNPARAFGPTLALGDWSYFWIYLAGPLIGMVAVALMIDWFLGSPSAR